MELVLHEGLPGIHLPFVEMLATTRTTSGHLARKTLNLRYQDRSLLFELWGERQYSAI